MVESGYSQTDLTHVHNLDMVESGHTQQNFHNEPELSQSVYFFEKAFILAWTLEETESVLLNLATGKCWKPKDMHKPRMQKRGDKEKPSQREGTHVKNTSGSFVHNYIYI